MKKMLTSLFSLALAICMTFMPASAIEGTIFYENPNETGTLTISDIDPVPQTRAIHSFIKTFNASNVQWLVTSRNSGYTVRKSTFTFGSYKFFTDFTHSSGTAKPISVGLCFYDSAAGSYMYISELGTNCGTAKFTAAVSASGLSSSASYYVYASNQNNGGTFSGTFTLYDCNG